MKERPILFKGEMVRAILDGRKTQTRRVCKSRLDIDFRGGGGVDGLDWNNPSAWGFEDEDGTNWGLKADDYCGIREIPCPHGQIGDQLWLRESFYHVKSSDTFFYRADQKPVSAIVDRSLRENFAYHRTQASTNFQPPIFMPRCASRIQLEITNVRVERLQDISEEDARDEGVSVPTALGVLAEHYPGPKHKIAFQGLWDSINADKHPWESNPWVWCISFRRI